MKDNIFYYACGNTAKGFVNFLQSNLENIDNVIALSHPSYRLKTEVIKRVISHFSSKYQIEIICSAYGSEFLDGAIVRDASIAILSDSITPLSKSYKRVNINGIDTKLDAFSKETSLINKYLEESYKQFAIGLKIHDQLEKVYIDEMDFSKADEITEQFIKELLYGVVKKNKKQLIYRRLFGTNTEKGGITVVPTLIEPITNRCFVKGRAGTGKSVFMKKVIEACRMIGLDIEVYHCSFDPNSIDMVIVRELDFCMFDSTPPHEFFPERIGDTVIDLYEATVTEGTDEKFASEIQRITKEYKGYMEKGIHLIKKAYTYREQIENKFSKMSKDVVENTMMKILSVVSQNDV